MVSLLPERRKVGKSGRAPYSRQRATRLSAEDKATLRARVESASLRELATEFGVSHETIRKTLNDGACVRALILPNHCNTATGSEKAHDDAENEVVTVCNGRNTDHNGATGANRQR